MEELSLLANLVRLAHAHAHAPNTHAIPTTHTRPTFLTHSIMEELSLLANLVRLADYLLVGGVAGRALAAAEDTLALLLAGREAVRRGARRAGRAF
jgi:hypothetical protein